MAGRQQTHAEYEQKLFDKQIDYFPLEEYQGCHTPIKHECLQGHVWSPTPANILSGKGCPDCAGLRPHTTQSYKALIPDPNIWPVEEYINTGTPILHECVLGHRWKAKPNNILTGRGCPDCNRVGVYNETYFIRNPEKASSPGVLYCVVLVNKKTDERVCVKIGITKGKSNKDVLRRAGGFTDYEARVQKVVVGTLLQVFRLEQELHALWGRHKYKSEWKFGGSTELFSIDILPDILRSIPNKI